MDSRNFSEWLKSFRASINGYEYYTDFDDVYEKASKYKTEIYIINSLVGSKNIEEDFVSLLEEYPNCLKVIPILLAVRSQEIFCRDEKGAVVYCFDRITQSIEQYKYFMRRTGLFDLLQNHIISNLYDYVTGVEVGLGSNGRKNRGGHQMENLVESFIKATGVEYYKEMYLSEIESKWGIDLSKISGDGVSTKRWDFVAKTDDCIYVIETNFYSGQGSKLNETARSYKMIAEEAKQIPNFEFVWITDGAGWKNAKGNLKETFNTLDLMYNISDLENNILVETFSKE